jgi:hypothetical protein
MLGMTDRICPINNRACRCDPNAEKEKFRPCMLAKRIGASIRLLASDIDRTSAINGLLRLLPSAALTFNDLAVLIENCDGQIEERKYSDSDAEIIFAKGQEKGRKEEARKQTAPPEFYDTEGQPRWQAIAVFCQNNIARLRSEWERTFINDMAGNTLWRQPTPKQAKHLLAIFVKLGGKYAC